MLNDLKLKYKQLDVAEKLITVNVIVFILFRLLSFFFKSTFLFDVTELPSSITNLFLKPWSVFTYSFVHKGLWHLVLNMLMLYYASKLFLNWFTGKRLLTVYFLGALFGAILFVISFNIFPVFSTIKLPLLGASAAVMAILIFSATYSPNTEVSLFGMIKLKLWHLAVAFIALDFVQMPNGNAGGHIAHLGGALLGFLYASQLKKGNDIGSGFEQFMDTIASWFKPKPAKMKTVHRSQKRSNDKTIFQKERIKQEQIDAILDKISKSGYESLSKAEKDFLFQAGKE